MGCIQAGRVAACYLLFTSVEVTNAHGRVRGIASQPRRDVAPDHMEISDSDIKSALSILI